MFKHIISLIIIVVSSLISINCTTIYSNEILPYKGPSDGFSSLSMFPDGLRRRCPLCDSSVFSYCSEKLFHDSCCCHNPNNPYDRLPYQCQYADCNFLHSNTCAEHKLITACCCTNLFLFNRK